MTKTQCNTKYTFFSPNWMRWFALTVCLAYFSTVALTLTEIIVVILRLRYTMCDKENKRKILETLRLQYLPFYPPKSAILVFTMIQSKLFSYRKKIYILYIKRLHVHHVKTMCFIHSYPQKCLLKSEQTRIENKMYSTLATC